MLASAAKSGNPNEYLAKILVFLGHKDFSSKMIDPDEIDFFEYIEGMDDDNDKKKGLMEYLRSIERIEFNISNKNIESISKAYESVKKKRATKANWK